MSDGTVRSFARVGQNYYSVGVHSLFSFSLADFLSRRYLWCLATATRGMNEVVILAYLSYVLQNTTVL